VGTVSKKPSASCAGGQGKCDYVLDFPVPDIPTLPGQPNASVLTTKTTTDLVYVKKKKKVHGKKKKFNYIENPTKCPSGGYPWKLEFGYENGESLIPTDNAPC